MIHIQKRRSSSTPAKRKVDRRLKIISGTGAKKCRQGFYGRPTFETHNEKVHTFLDYWRYGNREF